MNCSRCQADNRAGVKFCESCGAALDLSCPRCGASVPPDKRFCGVCGATLAIPAARTYASPYDYTPEYLAERILRGRETIEGERKLVTVLFADVRGSLELLADRDPEDAARVLEPVLKIMMDAVHRYEGTVNQVMGDGIMALFGAPLAHEDHGIRACYAALRMQESVAAFAAELRQSDGLNVQIRIGLNSGEVVVRSVGTDLRMDYTAVGQTTHLAGRMEQLAHAGKTFLTADTLRLAEGFVSVKPLGLVPVRGLPAPIPVYELVGPGRVQSRLQLATVRGLSRFVGRQAEIADLNHAMAKAGNGQGQVVELIGEPGVGKSRLAHEFTAVLSARWRLLTSSATSLDTTTAYLPIIALLGGYFEIQYGDDARRIREKVTASLLGLDESLLNALPALLTVLGVPLEDATWQDLEPRQRRTRALEAVRRVLLRESQRQPLCLVIEDLHWVDPEALAVMDGLVEALPGARILLLVTSRADCRHGWHGKSHYTRIAVKPLPTTMAAELLRGLLGESADVAALSADLIERTEGNAFFLEESVRHLVETGVLAGRQGNYRIAKASVAWEVPATVQALLAARIDRLSPVDKHVLQCAAVVGKDVPARLLEAIADLPQDELRRCLAALQVAEFLHEKSLFPAHEYTFRHALTLDVAYGALLQERRRALHARIVAALERSLADQTVEQIERLAYHALKGEAWPKAVLYLRQAGERAATRSLNREALARFREALLALEHVGESREDIEQAIDICIDMRHCLLSLGGQEQIAQRLGQAAELAARIDDQRRLGWIFSYMAHHWWYTGVPKSAIEWGERALSIADTVDDAALRVLTNFHLGQAYHALGNYCLAINVLARTVSSPDREILADRFGELYRVRSNSWLAWSHAELGHFEDGEARAEDGIRIAEDADQPFSLITACVGAGMVFLRKGELPKAAAVLERGLGLAQARDLPVLIPTVASRLGAAYALLGRMDEAFPLLERAAKDAAAMHRLSGHALRITQLGEAYLLAGRVEQALSTANQALALSVKHQEEGYQAWALRLLAEAQATHKNRSGRKAAHAAYEHSLKLAATLGMRPLMAHCHLGLSRLYRQSGEPDLALEKFRTAMDLYRLMNMRFWLERAQGETSIPA